MRRTLTLFAVLLIAGAASAATLQETFDRTFDVRPGTLFALNNTNGRITIRAWDHPQVQVHALKKVDSRDSNAARKAMAALKIEPAVSADSLRINTIYPKQNGGGFLDWLAGTNVEMSVQYDVSVPRSMNVNLDNTNGGIDITGVIGSHQISNTNGHINLIDSGGDVEAETTNGSIRAELAQVTPRRSMRLETTNGRITIAMPKSFGARVDAETTNGSITTDLPVTTTHTGERHALRGTINGGGTAELRLRTTNGSITIEAR